MRESKTRDVFAEFAETVHCMPLRGDIPAKKIANIPNYFSNLIFSHSHILSYQLYVLVDEYALPITITNGLYTLSDTSNFCAK